MASDRTFTNQQGEIRGWIRGNDSRRGKLEVAGDDRQGSKKTQPGDPLFVTIPCGKGGNEVRVEHGRSPGVIGKRELREHEERAD